MLAVADRYTRILERERERAPCGAPCAYTPRPHENKRVSDCADTIGFRHTQYRRAPVGTKTGGHQAGFVDTQYRRAPAGKTGEHRKGPAGVGEHRRQTLHLDPQNRGTGGRPSIGRTKSVTRDTSTKVRYRGQRFTHAARSCLGARGQRTAQNRTMAGTQVLREMRTGRVTWASPRVQR
jgi:hypothetical protein